MVSIIVIFVKGMQKCHKYQTSNIKKSKNVKLCLYPVLILHHFSLIPFILHMKKQVIKGHCSVNLTFCTSLLLPPTIASKSPGSATCCSSLL